MSYILDALKKIEHEKRKKSHPAGRVSISGDLFQDRKQPVSRAGIWKTVAIIAVVSLVTCAGTWYALQGNGRKSTAKIRPATPPPSQPVSAISPIAAPPVPAPVQPQSAPVSAPSAAPPAAVPAAVPAAPINADTAGDDESLAREGRRSRRLIKMQPPSPNQPAQAVQAPAEIKLSGIAWQDERSGRRAVINGFLLKEGAVVSGAKIIEIQADRVRFSSSAGQFEIKLDAVLPAEVKK